MKRFQSYEQFETELKREDIPQIDLEKTKNKIRRSARGESASVRRRKVYVLVAAVILAMCFGTVAMAVYNGWQLIDKNGEVVLSFSQYEKKEFADLMTSVNVSLDPRYSPIRSEILEELAPGEMAYFMVTEAYEINNRCNVLQREEYIYDLEELRQLTSTKFKIPEYLPDSYRFEYGMIYFKEEGDRSKEGEALYQEAKRTGQDFMIKKGKLTKEANNIWLKYVNDEGYKLTISISARDNLKSLTADIDTIEKFSIDDKEVLYVKGNPYDTDSYIFVDGDSSEKLTYSITNNGYNEVLILDSDQTHIELNREEATRMIRSFK